MFHENTELFPSGDSYDISPVKNDPTERIPIVLVGITTRNQFGWGEVVKDDQATLYLESSEQCQI